MGEFSQSRAPRSSGRGAKAQAPIAGRTIPVRCGVGSLPAAPIPLLPWTVPGAESASVSIGFLGGFIDETLHDIVGSVSEGAGTSLGFLFGSLDNAPPKTESTSLSVGFLSGGLTSLIVSTTVPAESGALTASFLSGTLANVILIEDLSSSPENASATVGFQTGALFNVILREDLSSSPENATMTVGFQVGAATQIIFPVTPTENVAQSVGFLSGALV